MQTLGPFTPAPIGGSNDHVIGGASGLPVGMLVTNLTGALLQVVIGARTYWLPAYRENRYALGDEIQISIITAQTEFANAVENQYLLTIAYVNDAPDELQAFPGTYPADISRAASIQITSGAVTITSGSINATIVGTPTVSIGNTPAVTISGTPSVVISSGTVAISGTPTVILGGGTASIGSISAIGSTVTVAGIVNIGNTPAVTISGTPSVVISSGTVSIGGTPNINISSQSVDLNAVLAQVTATGPLTNVNDDLEMTLNGAVSVSLSLTGTLGAGDIYVLEASVTGVLWVGLIAYAYYQLATGSTHTKTPVVVSNITPSNEDRTNIFPSSWRVDVSGFKIFRIRKVASSGNSITVTMVGVQAPLVAPQLPDHIFKSVVASVAVAATVVVWTPSSAVVRWHLVKLMLMTNTTGELQVHEGALTVLIAELTARTSTEIPLGPGGLPASQVNLALGIFNNTGATTGVGAFAQGAEVS